MLSRCSSVKKQQNRDKEIYSRIYGEQGHIALKFVFFSNAKVVQSV